jgi:hypothetical protein
VLMDGHGDLLPIELSASSQPRKKQCTEAQRASALSAKAEKGRVKMLHRQTLWSTTHRPAT